MRFELEIPDPATMRVGKEAYVTLPASTELHRIHRSIFAADEFNPTDKGSARFSPIRDQNGDIIPTIYAAESFDCAVCEIILRCPDSLHPPSAPPPLEIVSPSDFKDFSHSAVSTTLELKLVDLTNAGQRKIGVNKNALVAGPRSTYPLTRSWAEKIHASCPKAHGLYYTSLQLGPRYAVVLFGDRLPRAPLAKGLTRDVADTECHAEIEDLATSLSIDYADI